MRYITDQAVEQIPTLEDADAETRRQALEDAEAVYSYLNRSQAQRGGPVPEDALRTWGEGEEIDPDRMNRAIEVLRATDRVVALA